MKCNKCGLENPEGSVFCSNCGTPLPKPQAGSDLFTGETQIQPPYYSKAPWEANQPAVPDTHKPITPLGYVGYSILFSIPLVGIIMIFVFAFGGTANVNLRNFARGMLITILIAIVITVVLTLILGPAFTQYIDQYSLIRL